MQSNSTPTEPQTLGVSGDRRELLYRPALWALYSSLISLYLIMRFGSTGDRWPTRQDLQLEILWAAIGTFSLLVSSVTIYKAKRAATGDRWQTARGWLWLTLLLGVGFAVFQVSEYRRRWVHNLIPAPLSSSLHDRADLYYLSAVQQRLIGLATEINSAKVRQNQLVERMQDQANDRQSERARTQAELGRLQAEESQRTERLAVINRLLVSEVKWTSSVVATSDKVETQRMAIAALAYDIHAHRAFATRHQQFRQLESQQLEEMQAASNASLLAAETSAKENSEPIKELLSAVAKVKSEQQGLESQLKSHLRQVLMDEEQEAAPEQGDDAKRVTLERQLAEVQGRLEIENEKLTAAAKLVTDAEDNAARLSQELRSVAARNTMIAEIDHAGVGLNRQYPWLRLPVCIPGGTSWAWTYFTLTILHAIHLAYDWIVVLLIVIVARAGSDRFSKTNAIVRNWHGMVIVWSMLFVLIYLI